MNPKEVVLKFEKVYLPCVLVSKKRYVGYCYESEEQEEGHLDAKGIEMVRRDNCLATTKLQEKVLRILFTTKNLSFVKAYLMKQWTKISIGLDKVPLKDFMFSKEVCTRCRFLYFYLRYLLHIVGLTLFFIIGTSPQVRLGHYATGPSGAPKNLPPGAVVAHKVCYFKNVYQLLICALCNLCSGYVVRPHGETAVPMEGALRRVHRRTGSQTERPCCRSSRGAS